MRKLTLAGLAGALVALIVVHGTGQATVTTALGLYPAIVITNADPQLQYRLEVEIPAISTTARYWALPCAPYTNGSAPALPPNGTHIWVAFEGGNPGAPVWVGWQP